MSQQTEHLGKRLRARFLARNRRRPPASSGTNITIVYFVLSHTNVPHVVRLIRALLTESPHSTVLVHHDATAEPFDRAAFASEPRVRLLDRFIHGEWGQYSLVEIALLGIEDLAARGTAYDWLVLLSGQDYPVRPLPAFEAELVRSGDGMIAFDPAPGTLLDRYRFSWFRAPRALEHGVVHRAIGWLTRFNSSQPLLRFLSGRVGCRIGFAPARPILPAGMAFYKGTQWWALSQRTIAYVRDFIASHPDYVRHFREHTIIPDESFFQTIVFNAPPEFKFTSDDGRYTKWGGPGSASPELLVGSDRDAIVASGKFFARKFDQRADAWIIDAFDVLRGD